VICTAYTRLSAVHIWTIYSVTINLIVPIIIVLHSLPQPPVLFLFGFSPLTFYLYNYLPTLLNPVISLYIINFLCLLPHLCLATYNSNLFTANICDINFKNTLVLNYLTVQLLYPVTSDGHAASCTHISLQVGDLESFKCFIFIAQGVHATIGLLHL
jgi:hypothetical protein